jgi:murein DD-endopeptidase MepM/ murein hydrolase activator NlpD
MKLPLVRGGFVILATALASGGCATAAVPNTNVGQGALKAVYVATETEVGSGQTQPPDPTPYVTRRPPETPAGFLFPTAIPSPTVAWRPPPYPVPWALTPDDHFFFARPIPSGEVNWPNPMYRYGSTFFGEETIHTGVDLDAARGTPVLAAGPGEVVWTGYGLYRGVVDESDPYGLAVAIRHDFGYEGQTLWTVYAHMSAISAWVGQHVETGDVIGAVGDTGHTTGPHLHFEVRLGDNSYFSTRDPELWMVPPEGWGILAGRIEGSVGQLLPEQQVIVTSIDNGQHWELWTYANQTIHPDAVYGENFVISDLPMGAYTVSLNWAGRSYSTQLYLLPGRTNLVEFHGWDGFVPVTTPTPDTSGSPPYP